MTIHTDIPTLHMNVYTLIRVIKSVVSNVFVCQADALLMELSQYAKEDDQQRVLTQMTVR